MIHEFFNGLSVTLIGKSELAIAELVASALFALMPGFASAGVELSVEVGAVDFAASVARAAELSSATGDGTCLVREEATACISAC